jgi:hypothetical protein
VDKGRELRADFKLIGKALTRKGNALVKLDRWEELSDTRWIDEVHRRADKQIPH